eukprot:gnl/TRDRNA2_/TRDRNA2_133270_c0_seq1.p1 gnl/TRDRNA2_/TRDRNA2_133270_c0~~gnl/TRDRNA2_/TRDRNA2_133270_c0_seq1.p1  ORF type:complete len:481 (+),score=63.41 gnl/TRDRNA2_/TRDRNA2_133270_c0_seq1:71-1513(+)
MTSCDSHGYVHLEGSDADRAPRHRRRTCALFCSLLSVGILGAMCKLAPCGLGPQSLPHLFPTLRMPIASKDQPETVNFASFLQGGMGKRIPQTALHPSLRQGHGGWYAQQVSHYRPRLQDYRSRAAEQAAEGGAKDSQQSSQYQSQQQVKQEGTGQYAEENGRQFGQGQPPPQGNPQQQQQYGGQPAAPGGQYDQWRGQYGGPQQGNWQQDAGYRQPMGQPGPGMQQYGDQGQYTPQTGQYPQGNVQQYQNQNQPPQYAPPRPSPAQLEVEAQAQKMKFEKWFEKGLRQEAMLRYAAVNAVWPAVKWVKEAWNGLDGDVDPRYGPAGSETDSYRQELQAYERAYEKYIQSRNQYGGAQQARQQPGDPSAARNWQQGGQYGQQRPMPPQQPNWDGMQQGGNQAPNGQAPNAAQYNQPRGDYAPQQPQPQAPPLSPDELEARAQAQARARAMAQAQQENQGNWTVYRNREQSPVPSDQYRQQ